jgi:integrase
MEMSQLAQISGVNFEKLPSGKYRVKIGKKITGGDIIRKTGNESFVCKIAQNYVDAWKRNRDSSIYITDAQRSDAKEALQILHESGVYLTLIEVARAYCARLPINKGITCRDACDAYLKIVTAKKRNARYVTNLKFIFDSFCHLYGSQLIFDISDDDLTEWLDVSCLNKAPKTYNAYLTSLRSVFAYATKRKWVTEDVSLLIDKMPLSPAPVGVFTPDEMKNLLQAACDLEDTDLLLSFAIQAFAGLRRSEVRGLTWGDVGNSSIRVTPTNAKTNKGRGVEILPALQRILKLFPQWKDGTQKSKLLVSSTNEFARKQKILNQANINSWPRNALRHSYCSYRLAMTKDAIKTSYEVGNSPDILRAHYDAVVDASEAGKYFKVKISTSPPKG